MKNILLSTTGTSPQVLTETLYSIYQSGRPFPNEVYVITTKSRYDSLVNGLFRDGHQIVQINLIDKGLKA